LRLSTGRPKLAQALFVAEPPFAYQVRPALVVDCSLLSAVLFQESTRDMALQQLAGRSLHAPNLLDHEIANVAVKKQRQNWPVEAIELALTGYALQQIEYHRVDVAAQVLLAQQYKLSAYDAAYLWLAAEIKAPLATFDEKLARAARAHLNKLP
jgi:predicted nucleic acid-binding protein